MKHRPFFYLSCAAFLLSLGTKYNSASTIIQGNSEQNSSITFTFPIGITLNGDRFFIASREPGAGKYALSSLDNNKTEFTALTPEFATVNGENEEKNPLFNQQIEHITLLSSTMGTIGGIMKRPAVSIANDPGLYLIFDTSRVRSTVVTLDTLKDSEGKTTSGIVGLASGSTNFVCAAVKGCNQELFGEGASGIAVVVLTEDIPAGDYRKREMLVQTDAQHQEFRASCASPFNNKSPMVRFETGGDATILDNAIDMHWDDLLQRLFIAYRVKTSEDEESGARALAIGVPQNGRMRYVRIAPDTLFNGAQDKIVGVKGAGACASVHQVKTLHFNGWSQAIILGGSGELASSRRTVFALPIVNGGNLHEIGSLASIDATLEETRHPKTGSPTRAIVKAASEVDQIYTASSAEAQVGGGPLDVGDIETIFVHNAAVYALVSSADEGRQPGLFVSHALLKPNGMVSGWTTWQRVAGFTQEAEAVNIDVSRAAYTFVTEQEGQTVVTQTKWGHGNSNSFGELINEVNGVSGTEQEKIAIEHVASFSSTNGAIQNSSLLVCTGTNRVILAQTARIGDEGELIICSQHSEHKQNYLEGAVDEIPEKNTSFIEFSGGELEKLGPIVSAEIAHDAYFQNGWLFVGGVHGLAVLAYPNGSGWNPRNNELGYNFNGLRPGMQFMRIGAYRFVKKLFYDSGFLYVLTDRYLDRIDLSRANFAADDFSDSTVRLASAGSSDCFEHCSVFYDCLVSEKICLLATSSGLFRIGNGQDITQVQSANEVNWKLINTSEILPPVQLASMAVSGISQDVARDDQGGIVYVLCSDRGFNRACCYRLVLTNTSADNCITDNTITSRLALRFKDARTRFAIDGACVLSARNQNLPYACSLFGRNRYRKDTVLQLDDNATRITSIVQCKATGTWFIAGDFGLRVNE